MIDKIKNTLLVVFGISAAVFAYLYFNNPKLIKETRTVESKYWQEAYISLQTKYLQNIQKNIETFTRIKKEYDENGKIKSETTEIEKKDLSKVDTSTTSTSTAVVTVTQYVKEKDVTKYESTAFLFLNLGAGVAVDPGLIAVNKTFNFNIENVSAGITVRLKPVLISIDYQNVKNYPDIISTRIAFPLF